MRISMCSGTEWVTHLNLALRRRSARAPLGATLLSMSDAERSPLTGTEEERRILARWAADCVERVLPLFENACPGDVRPHEAVAAARVFAQGDSRVGAARQAALEAHAAARSTADPAARAAARAAGHAAGTAHMGGHARHAADYAVKAVFASASRDAAMKEKQWQYVHASDLVRAWVFREGTTT